MSDDTDSPPEREMKDFQFRQMKKAKVFEPSGEMPRERSSLLAISNKFGLTFAGSGGMFKVYRTQDILAADKQDGTSNTIVDGISALVDVKVESALHNIALSGDELTLSVCAASEEATLSVSFFDVRTFVNEARPQKLPFASWQPTVPPETLVLDLKWNPTQASMLAACLSDGTMSIMEVADDVRVQAALPASSGVTCLCWSPKGKQVAVGKMNGTVSQYTPALEEKKVIPCPHFYTSDNPVKVLDVLWLRTYSFAVVYAAADGSPETPPELVLITIPKKDEKVETKYLNFSDTVYGCCTVRQHHYFLSHIEDWNVVLAASAASIEVSVIARQDDKIWELWVLEDASRAELPVSETSEDTLPLGLAIDYTSQQEIRISDEKTLPPAPTLLMLSTEGLLCPFALLNLNPGIKQLITPCAALTTEGERSPKPGSLAVQPPKSAAPPASAFPNLAVTSVAASSSAAPLFGLVLTPPTSSSSGFTFSIPPISGNLAPPTFSLGSSMPIGSGVPGFSFAAAKPPTETPSAFSFSTLSNKVAVPTPQNLATPSIPAVKLNLNDRFSAVEAPAALPPSFSFMTSMPKSVVSNGSVPALAAITTKPATVSIQTSTSPVGLQKPSPAPQGRIQTTQQVATEGLEESQKGIELQAAGVGVKPVEKQQPPPKKEFDPIMTGILEEISHFQKELEDFKARSSMADFKVGTNEEMKELRKESEDLNIFTLEIKETTESLHSDIGTLKTTLLEGFAGGEEAKSQSELSRDRNYRQLLYKRPLDPRSEEQLREIRRLYQYVMFAVEDVNGVLDVEWEKHLEKKRHLVVPGREGLFTTLANNLYIINQQKNRLDQLVNKLTSLHLYNKTEAPMANSNMAKSGSMESELDSLRDALLKARLDTASPKAKSPSPVKISPVKQSQLRNFLSKGHMPPVRSTAPANLSRSVFLSPKYYEDLDDVSSTSSLSQSMEPHLPHLEVEEEEEEELQPECLPMAAAAAAPPSYPRHPTVVRTPSIQPGFGAIQSTPLSKMQSVPGMGFGLSPFASPIPTNKINLSGAESTALATKTVKHGAPPAERTVPVTIPAQQAAATAALRRLMANQKMGVSTSLTESALKTVPQVVNVQELKDKGAPVSTLATISSSTTDPAAVPLQVPAPTASILPKRNPVIGVQKPTMESTSAPQANFMFGQFTKADTAVAPTSSAELNISKGFSFTSTPSSFSFSSVTPAAGIPPVKDMSEFSFVGNGKMIFGQTVEEPSKSSSAALTAAASATQPPSTETPIPVSTIASARIQPQPPKTTAGETLGSFSGLRVGQGEDAKDSPAKSTPANSAFTFGGTGIGKGTVQFSFGGDRNSAGDSLETDLSKSSSLFKPPETTPKLTFCVSASNTPASGMQTSFSSLLAAAEPTEDLKPVLQPSDLPSPPEKSSSPEPSVMGVTPLETPKPSPDAPAIKEPDAVPDVPASVSAAEATPPAPAVIVADANLSVTSVAPVVPVSQVAPAAFQVSTPEKPGSIFTQPTTSDRSSPAVTAAVNATAAPEAAVPTAADTASAAPSAGTVTDGNPAFSVASTTSVATVFGQPAATPAVSTAPSAFGSSTFGTSTAGGFGKSVFGQPSAFGQPTSNTATAGGFSFGQSAFGASTSAATTGGGSLFGASTPSNASSFSFGTSTNANTSSSTGTGLFGQSTTSAFGQSSTFGQGSLFGSNTTTSSSTGFSFGQPSGFGSSPSSGFGQQANTGSVFGRLQQPSSGGLFGSNATSAAGSPGGSLFSGLGGKPSEDAANKNPFGLTASPGGFGQPTQTGTPSLFGSTVAKPMGFGQASFGEQKPSGTFSSGAGTVASQGFGSFASPTKPGGFGSAPVFGSPHTFGTSPSFGTSAAFSASPSFSNTMGSSAGKVFGEGTAASNMGGFGFASPSGTSSFGALANQSAQPSFGSLAQQGPGFGAQPGGFAGFGQQPQPGGFSGNTFGSTNQSGSQTFAGWRS
ncbi:nuclear pore complex protein Nup214 isoform X2 [Phyllopteryx taeniolatus]|uniref:nuclear pore complex protein Nup214 isoform X2 n=1 Tax=Phyllopteryx taeniolatus TaxID=161469 RepID=UPI002AD48FCD|nr:nuclear pore complex protein Nup214 isoform X2 [Phyllopteryx taeniolatus]